MWTLILAAAAALIGASALGAFDSALESFESDGLPTIVEMLRIFGIAVGSALAVLAIINIVRWIIRKRRGS